MSFRDNHEAALARAAALQAELAAAERAQDASEQQRGAAEDALEAKEAELAAAKREIATLRAQVRPSASATEQSSDSFTDTGVSSGPASLVINVTPLQKRHRARKRAHYGRHPADTSTIVTASIVVAVFAAVLFGVLLFAT